MTDINLELFKRYAPKKKLEIIEKLVPSELMNITLQTLTRIVKEAGSKFYQSRDKILLFSANTRRGNSWNSEIVGIALLKGRLFVEVYIQYENTDTSEYFPISKLLSKGETRFDFQRTDRNNNLRTYYAYYDEGCKQRVLKSILVQYVQNKYADKLKEEQNHE